MRWVSSLRPVQGVSEDVRTLPVPKELPGPGYGAFHCVWKASKEKDDTGAVDKVLMGSVGIKPNFSPASGISGLLTTPAVIVFLSVPLLHSGGNE